MPMVLVACTCLALGFLFGRMTTRARITLNELRDERARYVARHVPIAPIVDIRPEPIRTRAPVHAAH